MLITREIKRYVKSVFTANTKVTVRKNGQVVIQTRKKSGQIIVDKATLFNNSKGYFDYLMPHP